MTSRLRRSVRWLVDIMIGSVGLIAVLGSVIFAFFLQRQKSSQPRLLWGALPIKTLSYSSAAMRKAGFNSETVTIDLYPIVHRDNFDHCLVPRTELNVGLRHIVVSFRAISFFVTALHRYDIFHYFCDGGVLQNTLLKKLELPLIKITGGRVVLMPYGSDAFVYDEINNPTWVEALMLAYPQHAKRAPVIKEQLAHGAKYADCIVGCLVHTINLPRVDVLPLIWYPVDVENIDAAAPKLNGPVRIVHASNHRGPKGTKYIIEAVKRLQEEGFDIEFELIEKIPNEQALGIIRTADIYVDQLIFGYALAALEAMAYGKIVISGIEPEKPEYREFSNKSYLDECPVIPAGPNTIYSVLKNLIIHRNKWSNIGIRTRAFAEKRHSYQSTVNLFEQIYKKIWYGEVVDLATLFVLDKTTDS